MIRIQPWPHSLYKAAFTTIFNQSFFLRDLRWSWTKPVTTFSTEVSHNVLVPAVCVIQRLPTTCLSSTLTSTQNSEVATWLNVTQWVLLCWSPETPPNTLLHNGRTTLTGFIHRRAEFDVNSAWERRVIKRVVSPCHQCCGNPTTWNKVGQTTLENRD